MYRHLPLQDPPKFTQIWIFVLKIYHLATLLETHLQLMFANLDWRRRRLF
jgi:hypothetical protein